MSASLINSWPLSLKKVFSSNSLFTKAIRNTSEFTLPLRAKGLLLITSLDVNSTDLIESVEL